MPLNLKTEEEIRAAAPWGTAALFVMCDRDVLVRRVPERSGAAGLWTVPFFPIENTEATMVAALAESLGFGGAFPVLRDRVPHDRLGGQSGHVFVFQADVPIGEKASVPESSGPDSRWIDLYDLAAEVSRHPGYFSPWLRSYFGDHAHRIFGVLVNA